MIENNHLNSSFYLKMHSKKDHLHIHSSSDQVIRSLFSQLKQDSLEGSRALSNPWNLRSRASNPRHENQRFNSLIHYLQTHIPIDRYPEIVSYLEKAIHEVHHQVATGHLLSQVLFQQKKELIHLLTQLNEQDFKQLSLSIFHLPKGFSSLLALIEVEKRLQELDFIPDQLIDQSYDDLTLDEVSMFKLSDKARQLIDMVSILAELQDLDRIYALVQKNTKLKGVLLGTLFDFLIHANRLKDAYQIALSIPMKGQNTALLLQLAELYKQDPHYQAYSEEIFQQAYAYLAELTLEEKQLVDPLAKNLLNQELNSYLD